MDINQADKKDYTPLHLAVMQRDLIKVRILV